VGGVLPTLTIFPGEQMTFTPTPHAFAHYFTDPSSCDPTYDLTLQLLNEALPAHGLSFTTDVATNTVTVTVDTCEGEFLAGEQIDFFVDFITWGYS